MKLKVISYNIHKGFAIGGIGYVLRKIKTALKDTMADVVLLQEVVGEEWRTVNNETLIENQFEFLADKIWNHFSYGKNAVFSGFHYGNAILSRYPIVHEKHTLISTNKFEQRGLLHCVVEIPNQNERIHFYNVHLDIHQWGRRRQYQKIVSQIKSNVASDEKFIMAGDFNDWTSELNQLLIEDLKFDEAHTKLFERPAKTFPSFYPLLTLDRVYSQNLNILHCEPLIGKPWKKLSDHIPLLVEYAL